jgi:WD40 repeat protein
MILGGAEEAWGLFDVETGDEIRIVEFHRGGSAGGVSVAFSPSGDLIATAGGQDNIALWRFASLPDQPEEQIMTQAEPREKTPHSRLINSLAVSPVGDIVAGANEAGEILLWDLVHGRFLRSFPGHNDRVDSISFTLDGRLLATASRDQTVKLWDWENRRLLYEFPQPGSWPGGATFGAGDEWLATRKTGGIQLWSLKTGEPIRTLEPLETPATAIACSSDGRLLLAGCLGGEIVSFDLISGTRDQMKAHQRRVTKVIFSPDASLIATTGINTGVNLFNTRISREDYWSFPNQLASALAFDRENSFLAAVVLYPDPESDMGGIKSSGLLVWDVETGQEYRYIEFPSINIPLTLVFTRDGSQLVCGTMKGELEVWDIGSSRLVRRIR